MHEIVQDLRTSFHSLRKAPGFAAVAILTLALGIGANSAIFSVVDGVLLTPLAYEEPDRLLFVTSAFPGMGFHEFWVSEPEYLEYREWNTTMEDVGAYNVGELSVTGGDSPLRVVGAVASRSFFTTLGVQPVRGRIFTEEEDSAGGPEATLLSWELWQRAFGGREDLVGETVEVNGTPATVVGILPPGFDIDDNGVELWRPAVIDPADPAGRASHYLYLVARLRDGVSLDQARAELDTLVANWHQRIGDTHTPSPDGHPLQFEPLTEEVVGEIRPALLLLLGAVGFVLLIACANVGNLLLARAESRQKEIAVRSALGASRGRLLRLFMTESTVLAVLGGAAGLLAGHWGLRLLLAVSPDSIPRTEAIGLDASVLGFTLAVSVLTGLLFGAAPLLHLSAHSVSNTLREGGERSSAGAARQRLRRTLVVAEVALAVMLVVGAGLMLRSFSSLQDVDPGFDPEGLLTFRLYLPSSEYPEPPDVLAFHRQLLDRLETLPGVTTATAMSGLPPRRRMNANDTEFENVERTEDGPPHNVDYYQTVAPGYFDTMNVPIVEGRPFGPRDEGPTAAPVAIVNERLARTFYPDGSALGRRLRPCCGDDNPWLTIVGIAADVKQGGLEAETGTELYFYLPQTAAAGFAPRTMNVVVKTSVPPTGLAGQVRETVWSMDRQLPIADLQTMGDVLWESVARPRFLTLLLTVFGVVALALAAVGTYGVMSYSVAERSREMGIRMALGAERSGVLRMVLAQGLRVALVGLALGVAGAYLVTRLMESMLYGVSATDPVTFLAVPLLLVLVAAAACLIPALRATRVDPIVVLRS